MFWSTTVRVLAALALVAALVGIGVYVYDAGVSAGLTDAARQAVASGEPAQVVYPGSYHYGWGPGHGFGFFGIVFWILGILLIIGLVRAAFGFGRRGGPGGWGPGGWNGPGRERIEEWHRQLHERSEPGSST